MAVDLTLRNANKMIGKKQLPMTAELDLIKKLKEKQIKEIAQLIEEKKEEEPQIVEPTVRDNEGEWDVPRDAEIEYFDPELSYEITGYRPITQEKGLDFDPTPFCEVGTMKTKTGNYCTFPPKTKKYNDFWKREVDRCLYGLTIGKYTITGDNYFFLNYFQLKKAVRNERSGLDEQIMGFPNFQAIQYQWFHYYRMCELLRMNAAALKPRGVGWSMIAASMGANTYSTVQNSNVIYAAASDPQLKPTFQVVSDELEYLNKETNGGLAHLKGIDKEYHKRATYKQRNEDTGAYVEQGFKSQIVGQVIDDPNKMRGTRVQRLFFEEAGSNKNLITAFIQGQPLVTVNGTRVGLCAAWGCVTGDNIVYKGDGTPVKIKDLKQEDGILGFKDGHYNVEPITWMKPPAKKECIKICTNYGDIECSTDHPLYYDRIISRRVKGSYDKRWYEHVYEFMPAEEIVRKRHKTIGICNAIGIFGKDTLHDAYLSGLLIGDVSYDINHTPRLANCDNDVNDYVMNNHKTKDILQSEGIYGQTKTRKSLPNKYKTLTKENTALLLAGLFDTDGRVHKTGRLELDQSSEEILKQVAELLKKFGIWTRIRRIEARIAPNRKDKNDYWKLEIADKLSIYCFYKNIPIKTKYKRDRLKTWATKNYSEEFENGVRKAVIKSFEFVGEKDVYNLTAGDSHTYLVGNQFITHNTGGDRGPQLEGLRELFYNPEVYNILPYKNNFNERKDVVFTSFFIPYYKAMSKFMDARGVCDERKAIEAEEKAREKFVGKPDKLLKYKAEYCFTPEDVFMLEGSQRFDSERLAEQMANIELHKMYSPPIVGKLSWPFSKELGQKDMNARPTWDVDPNGKIKIVEYPMCDENNIPYANLYVAGVDSIDADSSTSSGQTDVSDFCIVIYKRILGMQPPKIVAIYKDRPRDVADAYRNAMKLCQWYNCKALVESSRVGIVTFFKQANKLDLLAKRPVATISGNSGLNNPLRTNVRQYGVIPSTANIEYANELIDNFISGYCHTIEFREVIDELLRYSFEMKRKFDIVAALGIALIGDEDMSLRKNAPRQIQSESKWQDVGYYIDEYGYRQFGVIPNDKRRI